MTTLAFVDTETTGLDPERHEVWEVALILHGETGDFEYVWQLPVDLSRAESGALTIGRYYERSYTVHKEGMARSPVQPVGTLNASLQLTHPETFASQFAKMTAGAHLVGAVPSFDAAFLSRLLRANGACPGWHHRLICVETMFMGYLCAAGVGESPLAPQGLAWAAGELQLDLDEHHTALGDARLARDVYDRIRRGDA